MRERAKEILLKLKENNVALKTAFDEYVEQLSKELERPKDIAVTLVTSELVNQHEKELILHELFSKFTLESVKK